MKTKRLQTRNSKLVGHIAGTRRTRPEEAAAKKLGLAKKITAKRISPKTAQVEKTSQQLHAEKLHAETEMIMQILVNKLHWREELDGLKNLKKMSAEVFVCATVDAIYKQFCEKDEAFKKALVDEAGDYFGLKKEFETAATKVCKHQGDTMSPEGGFTLGNQRYSCTKKDCQQAHWPELRAGIKRGVAVLKEVPGVTTCGECGKMARWQPASIVGEPAWCDVCGGTKLAVTWACRPCDQDICIPCLSKKVDAAKKDDRLVLQSGLKEMQDFIRDAERPDVTVRYV